VKVTFRLYKEPPAVMNRSMRRAPPNARPLGRQKSVASGTQTIVVLETVFEGAGGEQAPSND